MSGFKTLSMGAVGSGFDDLCGAAHRAPLDGTAVENPDGTVQLGVQDTNLESFFVTLYQR